MEPIVNPAPGFGQRRPFLAIALTTLALLVMLAAAGTAVFVATGGQNQGWHTQLLPVALVFPPVALWVALRLARADLRALLSLRSLAPFAGPGALLLAVPLLALLVQALEVAPRLDVGSARLLSCIALAVLVGFVEEGLYRGVFMHWLAPRGLRTAIWVSTAVFALTHAANAFGVQSLGATVLQIAFAAVFGYVAASLRVATGALLPLMVWHALFDILGFLGTREDNLLLAVNCVMLAGFGAWMAVQRHRRAPRTHTPRAHTSCAHSPRTDRSPSSA